MESEQHTLLEWYRTAMQHYHDARYAEAQAAHAQVRRLEPNGYCDSILTGMVCFEQQRFGEALTHYERALGLQAQAPAPYSCDPYPYIYASLVLMCLGRPEDALSACDRGSAALPDALVLYLHRGELLLKLGRAEQAADTYDQVLRRDPSSREALTYRGFALYAIGRLDESLEVHEQLLALEPELPEAHLFKGRVLEQQGRLHEALDCYNEAIRLDETQADAWAYKGGVLWQMRSQNGGKLSEAVACYEMAIRLDPASSLAHNGLGNVLMTLRRYREATSAYARASAIQPGVKAFRYNRQQAARAAEGLEPRDVWAATSGGKPGANPLIQEFQGLQMILKLMEDERLVEALDACERAMPMVRTPEFAEALLMMKGTILEALERYREALAAYEELIKIRPSCGEGFYWRARVLLKLDGDHDVLADLEVATNLDPTLQDAWAMRGDLLAETERYTEALDAFERALALPGGEDAVLYSKKGQVLSFLERHEQALVAYEQARDIDPDHQYHWMNLALGFSQLGRHAESLDAYNAAIQLDPHSPLIAFLFCNKGSELLALSRDEEALAWFEHAIAYELSSPDQQIMGEAESQDRFTLALDYYGKGQALSALGRDGEALTSFEAAAAYYPDLPDLADALDRAKRAVRHKRIAAAREEKTTASIYYLLMGVQGRGTARIARWFVKEGQRLRVNDPLVLLQSEGEGPSIMLRVSRQDSIAGSVVGRIFCSEGARVTQRDCLAVFTTSGDEARGPINQVEDLGALGQYPAASVDCVLVSNSMLRELLDRLFPGYARWYLQMYPLMQVLKMAGMLVFLGLGALVLHSTLDLLAALDGEASSTPWWDNLWLDLTPFFLGTLVFLSLLVLRWLAFSRTSPRRRASERRKVQK